MKLRLIEFAETLDRITLRPSVRAWLEFATDEIQQFWDRYPQRRPAIYTECDFELVAQALQYCDDCGLVRQQSGFIEWGCGFAVVAGVASLMGHRATGIEAEPFLAERAKKLLGRASGDAQVVAANFLPTGAEQFSERTDPGIAMQTSAAPVYGSAIEPLATFDIVFNYPWPGDEHFVKQVFAHYCQPGALLLLYLGPFAVELYQKTA